MPVVRTYGPDERPDVEILDGGARANFGNEVSTWKRTGSLK
jgi:hypothetical protein